MKFSLVQLLLCIGIVLVVSILLIQNLKVKPSKVSQPVQPGVTIPFMNIKMK